ncbi:hypothetical protein [Subtercola sp. YIM 133946]|uniref:hypothetical protein n=1 Tax=Subtercola sp. YIM 133946 TaxID=3118909 RepID=UPI002F932284
MTVPHDEQPLTRRQLRDLERQKPRKQQKEEAKAAEEAEAKRRADEAARAAAERAAFEADAARAVAAPAGESAVEAAVAEAAPVEAEPVEAETVVVEHVDPVEAEPVIESQSVAPAPILSRRARRALSADHPLAEQNDAGTVTAGAAGVAGSADPVDEQAPVDATGPVIAEIMPDEPVEHDVLTVDEPNDHADVVHDADAADDDADQVVDAEPMVEELMVIDDVAPELLAEEEDELAEIDDTPAPEPVHIVTIDETPSAPVLAPLFQAPAPGREATTASITPNDLAPASFDDLLATRGVGSSNSVTSTSALVLPSVPNHGDVGTALDETGEVIITGSIDLPMSLGSTGAAPADGLESSELDAFLDPESEVGSDVAPVSATRAISTHGPSSGLVAPPKRRGANAPLILAVTAGVLAVGVVGLLLAAFVFRIF